MSEETKPMNDKILRALPNKFNVNILFMILGVTLYATVITILQLSNTWEKDILLTHFVAIMLGTALFCIGFYLQFKGCFDDKIVQSSTSDT